MAKYSKGGVSAFLSTAAFLGGISFTSLLLLIKEDSLFQTTHILYDSFIITDLQIISTPLTISVILFITSSILFCIELTLFDESLFYIMTPKVLFLFLFGFIFLIVSLFSIIFLINVTLFFLNLFIFCIITIWWSVGYLKNTKRI